MGERIEGMYWIPIAVVTNYYQFSGLNQHTLFCYSLEVRLPESKCQHGCVPQGESVSGLSSLRGCVHSWAQVSSRIFKVHLSNFWLHHHIPFSLSVILLPSSCMNPYDHIGSPRLSRVTFPSQNPSLYQSCKVPFVM